MQEQEVLEQVEQPVEQQEKMLTQDQVNKVVQREKVLAAERARKEVEAEYQQRAEQASQIPAQQAETNENTSRELDVGAITQQVREQLNKEMQQKAFETEMSTVADNYLSKADLARTTYEDFDKVTANFNPGDFPQLVYLVSGMENGGSVIYELAKNPKNLMLLSQMAKEAPQMAQQELATIAQSITLNKQAVDNAGDFETPAPLDRLNPSRVSGGNGEQSIKDLKAAPWLRG